LQVRGSEIEGGGKVKKEELPCQHQQSKRHQRRQLRLSPSQVKGVPKSEVLSFCATRFVRTESIDDTAGHKIGLLQQYMHAQRTLLYRLTQQAGQPRRVDSHCQHWERGEWEEALIDGRVPKV